MIVGFNTLPLKNANKTRGVGVYARNLLQALKLNPNIEVKEFENIDDLKNVDLVHYPFFDLFFSTLPLKKKFPTVVTIHDVMPLIFRSQHPPGLKGKLNLFRQKFALKTCKQIITVSEVSKKDAATFLKIPKDKIKVIYEAADSEFKVLSDAQKLRVKRKFNLSDTFLLYVGGANYVKNLPFLIKGFYQLKKDPNFINLKLVLVGGVFLKKVEGFDHPELKSIKEVNFLINKFNLEEKVIRVGQLDKDDLVGFYNLATVYIQPSLYEGFGLPVLEAMSCGTSVVSSNGGSLPEVGGGAPVYFDPTESAQFTKILKEVLQSRSLQDKLSKLGLRQAQKFSWEKAADETIKVYRNATINK